MSNLLLGALALLCLTDIAAMILCLPMAWWVATRLEADEAGSDRPDDGGHGGSLAGTQRTTTGERHCFA